MNTYKFIKDYKNIDIYRNSFNNLAIKTFGIDFEPWYNEGYWNDDYVCYSYLDDDTVIANVSVNKMKLIINGNIHNAIQIGTVMTDVNYRRQGLAYQLMNKIFTDFDKSCDLYFLAADVKAIPIYEKCGFRLINVNQYVIDLRGYEKITKRLEPVTVDGKKILDIKRQSLPLSRVLSSINDEHILMFYYLHGFSKLFYQLDDDLYTIMDIKDDVLHLYGVFSPKRIYLKEVIEKIAYTGINKIYLHFMPDDPLRNLNITEDKENIWMVRPLNDTRFPNPGRFPDISQA